MSKKNLSSSSQHETGRLKGARTKLEPSTLFQKGIALHRHGRTKEALQIYLQILNFKKDYFDALHMAGLAYKQLAMKEQALHYFERAVSLKIQDANLQSNFGNLLLELQRLDEAICAYDQAIALSPDFSDAHFNKGIALDALKMYEQAIGSYTRAIDVNQERPEYFLRRGNTYQIQKRFDQSIKDYEEVLKLREDHYLGLLNLGIAYCKLRKFEFALKVFEKIEAIQIQDSNFYYYKGNAHRELGQALSAVNCYLRAIEIKPQVAKYYLDLGNAQIELKLMNEGIQSYRKTLALEPTFPFLLGHYVHMKCQIADWQHLDDDLQCLRHGVVKGEKLTAPFPLLSLMDDQELAQIASQIYCQDQCDGIQMATMEGDSNKFVSSKELCEPFQKNQQNLSSQGNRKLKIGYYSSDFYQHATAYLIAQLFEQHDKSQVELIGFCFSGARRDAMTQRIQLAFDQFHNVNEYSDEEVANLSREIGIDIAVDLKGYTQNSRPMIFAHRCAPVQVNYLGYPGTMSAPFIDFIVVDKTIIPESEKVHFSELPVYLPHCYQVNDSKREIAHPHSTRVDHGLPEGAFVFCCFNNTYKIQPAMFNIWMRILRRVQGSVLWLIHDSEQAAENLREHALRLQVDPSRLVFAKRTDLPNHLERHRHAQLFLDTYPYNAHTTASDALWSGVLVLTLMGSSFASRVGASLLHELKLDDLICKTEQEYEEKAVYWALHQDHLDSLRIRLLEARSSSKLFRGDFFAQSLEGVYKKMYFQYERGLGFESIDVSY
jgi:predicted O-linked N-acetylglucosamine transferase (SPINDLY family)